MHYLTLNKVHLINFIVLKHSMLDDFLNKLGTNSNIQLILLALSADLNKM